MALAEAAPATAPVAAASSTTPDLSVDSSIEERVNDMQHDGDDINLLRPDTPRER